MILIGAIIGSSRMGKLWDKDCFLYCLIRLGLIPAAVLLGCRLCGVESLVTGVSVVLAAMPMGGVTAVLAEKYGGDSAFASKCVAVSTVLSSSPHRCGAWPCKGECEKHLVNGNHGRRITVLFVQSANSLCRRMVIQ